MRLLRLSLGITLNLGRQHLNLFFKGDYFQFQRLAARLYCALLPKRPDKSVALMLSLVAGVTQGASVAQLQLQVGMRAFRQNMVSVKEID